MEAGKGAVVAGFVTVLLVGSSFATQFTDVAQEVGVSVDANADLGAGCALTDIDDDGDLDIMVVDGLGDPNVVFRQTGLRTFEEVGGDLGMDDTGWGKSLTFADFDNDGDQDVLLTRFATTCILYRNDGAVFTDISASAGFTFVNQTSGAAWADYDGDGLLDVYTTTYAENPNHLMRNLGGGVFEDVAVALGVEDTDGFGFQPAWLDYDLDGDMDLYVSHDIFGTPNVFYRNNGDGTFSDVSLESGTNLDMSAMGLAVGDYNNDGYPDIYITNIDSGNVLLRNNHNGTFTDVADEAGVRANVICWGADFLDFDHDGLLDLYMNVSSDDYVLAPPGLPDELRSRGGKAAGSQVYPNILFHNTGGVFEDVSAESGADNKGRSFCSCTGDYDGDGDLDIYITNWFVTATDSSCALYENNHIPRGSETEDWLRVKLIGTISNRDAVGARVWIRTDTGWQYRYRQAGSSYLSTSDPALHFGLGQATVVADLYVRWPSGLAEVYAGIPGGQTITLVEGDGVPTSAPGEIPTGLESFRAYPNPARAGARIALRLPPGDGVLRVHDSAGRLVRTIITGRHEGAALDWDGRDALGRTLIPGVYFLDAARGGRSQAVKFVILR